MRTLAWCESLWPDDAVSAASGFRSGNLSLRATDADEKGPSRCTPAMKDIGSLGMDRSAETPVPSCPLSRSKVRASTLIGGSGCNPMTDFICWRHGLKMALFDATSLNLSNSAPGSMSSATLSSPTMMPKSRAAMNVTRLMNVKSCATA
jgi:hypothetical protein